MQKPSKKNVVTLHTINKLKTVKNETFLKTSNSHFGGGQAEIHSIYLAIICLMNPCQGTAL